MWEVETTDAKLQKEDSNVRLWRQEGFVTQYGEIAAKTGDLQGAKSDFSEMLETYADTLGQAQHDKLLADNGGSRSRIVQAISTAARIEAALEELGNRNQSQKHEKAKEITLGIRQLLQSNKKYAVIPCAWSQEVGDEETTERVLLVLERKGSGEDGCLWLCHAGTGCAEHPGDDTSTGDDTSKQIVLRFPLKSFKQCMDEAVWWFAVYLRAYGGVFGGKFQGYEQFYHVLIPHILGGISGFAGSANQITESNNLFDWPKEGIGDNRNLVRQTCRACARVLMHIEGFTSDDIEKVFLKLDVGVIKRLQDDLKAHMESDDILSRADGLLIRSACRQIAHRELKSSMDPGVCQGLTRILEMLDEVEQQKVDKAGTICIQDSPAHMIPKLPKCPRDGKSGYSCDATSGLCFPSELWRFVQDFGNTFGILQSGRKLDHANTTSSVVDIDNSVLNGSFFHANVSHRKEAVHTFKEASKLLVSLGKQCESLRSATSAKTIRYLDLCSMIEKTFTQDLPIPSPVVAQGAGEKARTFWNVLCRPHAKAEPVDQVNRLRTKDQQQFLHYLYDVICCYVVGITELNGFNSRSRTVHSVNVITLGALLSIFDVVLRCVYRHALVRVC